MTRLEQIDVFTLVSEEIEFDFTDAFVDELEVLEPALERAGYFTIGHWYTLEGDSFGPLSRAVKALSPAGKHVTLWYG